MIHCSLCWHALTFAIDNGTDVGNQLAEVVQQLNHLSLPFCQIKLLGLFNAEAEEAYQNTLLGTFFKEIQQTADLADDVLTELINVLTSHVLRQVRQVSKSAN